MKLLSYNVLADCTTDYILREGVPIEHLLREHRTPLIQKVLIFSDADVICLQEVDQKAYDDYYNVLKLNYDGNLNMHKRMFGNACFWKKNLRASCSSFDFDDYSGRRAQLITLDTIAIINVHLDYNFGLEQIEKLLPNIIYPTIICGDFNASPTSNTLKKLLDYGFKTHLTKFTISRGKDRVIDYILALNVNLLSVTTMSDAISQYPNKDEGSDHITLISEFEFY